MEYRVTLAKNWRDLCDTCQDTTKPGDTVYVTADSRVVECNIRLAIVPFDTVIMEACERLECSKCRGGAADP